MTKWSPNSWRNKPIQQSAAGFRRRGAQAQAPARKGERGPRFPAAGRRLRGELRGAFGRQSIRDFFRVFLQMAVVLTFAGSPAGGEGRAHRRAVRQAALGPDGGSRTASSLRAIAATTSTASSSTRNRARRRPGAPDHGLPPVGRHAQPAAGLRARGLCQPRARAPLDARVPRARARRPNATRRWPTGSARP
jgi:hypothetical protein